MDPGRALRRFRPAADSLTRSMEIGLATASRSRSAAHCSVASRTESETCPSCGRSYERGGLQWRWWFAIPIVALAFAGGYFGLSQLVYDDDEPAAVTAEEAEPRSHAGTRRRTSKKWSTVRRRVESPTTRSARRGRDRRSCRYYAIADQTGHEPGSSASRGTSLASSEAVDLPAD